MIPTIRSGRGNIGPLVRSNATSATSFLLVLALAMLAAPVAAQAPAKDDLARARALDREGAKAYGEARYNDAIRYFEEAYRLGGPAFELWNVAKCYLRLDQPEQAAEMLERYLSMPNLPKEDREEASQQLDTLKRRPSPLTVSSTPSGAQVMLDGKKIDGRTPLSISVAPGQHTVTVSSAKAAPIARQVDARYGRAVIVDVSLAGEGRPAPPENPYEESDAATISLRGALNLSIPRHGSIGGRAGPGFLALGTYKLTEAGPVSIAAGGFLSLAADSWGNRTNTTNQTPTCGPLRDAQSATALSVFGIGTASVRLGSSVRLTGIGGLGLAGYFVDHVGGDLFAPSCDPSPGLRPTLLLGAQVDYALTQRVRLSAFPLTWQIHSAFGGARSDPRDASGAWMRIGIGVGAGVDL